MTIHYSSFSNTNAPVVALHSSASSSHQWNMLCDDLEGRFVVYAFDLPGCGDNPLRSKSGLPGVAGTANSVIEQIERIGEPVHLVGHSNGAGVAIKIALMRPELVRSLSIYEPATFHILADGDAACRAMYREIQCISGVMTAAAVMDDCFAGMKHFLDFWNGEGFWEQLSTATRQKFSMMINAILADFANGYAENWELSDLKDLEIPTLVMMGLESHSATQRVATLIANALPDARLALLPELGHMAPVFQPEWINPRILEHVTGVERPAVNCRWPVRKAA